MVMLTTKRFRLKDLVIYSSLILSGMYGVAHAALPIYDEFKKNPSAVEVIKQSDKVTTMLAVGQHQTARTPADIGKHRIAAMTERMAADQAVHTARTIVQAVEDATFGVGLSPTMTCGVVEEKQSHTTKRELSSQVRTAVSQSNAAMHFSKDGDRRAMRAKHHYENYCDITEMATGACLVSGNRRGGMNTDYSNIHNNLTLTDEQIDASYGFMHNIVDPAKSDYSFCTTLACEAVSQTEAQYHALGSMVQNSFLSQIQDSIAYDTPPGGARTITVEQKGALSEPWDGRLARWGETVYVGGGVGGGNIPYSNTPVPRHFTRAMAETIARVSANLGIRPNDLAAVISFETGGTFSPSKRNPGSTATGLIQFMANTARGLGTTTEALAAMSFDQQMVYVEKYFKSRGFKPGKPQTLADVYTAVTGCANNPPGVCYSKYSSSPSNREGYAGNKIWDTDGDGYVTKGEQVQSTAFRQHVRDYMGAVGLQN